MTLGCAATFGLVSTDDDREHAFDQLSLEASRFACKIGIGRHESLSDLKHVKGGNDMGPSPKEIFYSTVYILKKMPAKACMMWMKNLPA